MEQPGYIGYIKLKKHLLCRDNLNMKFEDIFYSNYHHFKAQQVTIKAKIMKEYQHSGTIPTPNNRNTFPLGRGRIAYTDS